MASKTVLYLTTLVCNGCEGDTTYAHEGANVPLDQDPPWPDVDCCPRCGTDYPDDLGIAVLEVTNAERVDPHLLDGARTRQGSQAGDGE